jgi:hypothetical protein
MEYQANREMSKNQKPDWWLKTTATPIDRSLRFRKVGRFDASCTIS